MAISIRLLVSRPRSLAWWQLGKLIGMGLLGVVGVYMCCGEEVPMGLLRITLHIALDFALQSAWVLEGKGDRGKALLFHALITGGIPGVASPPETMLLRVVVGIVSHYAIDYTRKFGCRDVKLGALLDQVAHLVFLV